MVNVTHFYLRSGIPDARSMLAHGNQANFMDGALTFGSIPPAGLWMGMALLPGRLLRIIVLSSKRIDTKVCVFVLAFVSFDTYTALRVVGAR